MKNERLNLPKYWRYFTLGFFMLSWIILVFILNLPEWVLIPTFIAYLAVNALIFFPYTLGMIGNYWYTIKHFKRANYFFEKAVKHNTHHVKALYIYALQKLQDGDGAEALKYFTLSEKYNFSPLMDKYISLSKSSCYWVMGNTDKAIELLENLISRYSYINTDVYTTLGYLYILKNDLEKAEEYTKKAIEDNDAHAPAWDNMGQIYYKKGEFEKAKEYFKKALEYKDLPDSLYFMGLISANEGNTSPAREYFTKALSCNISALNTVTKEDIQNQLNSL